MLDELQEFRGLLLRAGGGAVDTAGLAQALGIPVVPVSAALGEGLDTLPVSYTHLDVYKRQAQARALRQAHRRVGGYADHVRDGRRGGR